MLSSHREGRLSGIPTVLVKLETLIRVAAGNEGQVVPGISYTQA
jgi:hypothetical protein